MWAGLRLVNGYSPIRPAGVARKFAVSIHGEIDPDGQLFAQRTIGAGRQAGKVGVDGIVVAREIDVDPSARIGMAACCFHG